MVEEQFLDAKLWDTAKALATEQKSDQAVAVINSIASHAITRFSGKPVQIYHAVKPEVLAVKLKEIEEMKTLSQEIASLIGKTEPKDVQVKAIEYMDGLAYILSSDREEEKRVRQDFLKHLVRINPGRPLHLTSAIKRIKKDRQDAKEEVGAGAFTTSEAAEIAGVSDQTIRRWCEKGKFPGASQTEGGHWRIPRECFKMSPEKTRLTQADFKAIDDKTKQQLGEDVDEFDLDLDYS